MYKVGVGSVSKILLMLTQSLYVIIHNERSTLQAQMIFCYNRVVLLSPFHNYIITGVCMSFNHAACRLFGNVIVLFPD